MEKYRYRIVWESMSPDMQAKHRTEYCRNIFNVIRSFRKGCKDSSVTAVYVFGKDENEPFYSTVLWDNINGTKNE